MILAVDPGYATCGWVVMDLSSGPINFGAWSKPKDTGQATTVLERSLVISQTLQQIATQYGVTMWVTEQYYGGRQSPQTTIGRGVFDGVLNMALGHLHGMMIHPRHLKRYTTNHGNASKTAVFDSLLEELQERHPESHDRLLMQFISVQQGHILDAWGLGLISLELQKLRNGELPSIRSRIETLNAVERTRPDIRPLWSQTLTVPDVIL